jgi:cyclopropane-fatty-acyl-phospholipid synthase
MSASKAKALIGELLSYAGIAVDGDREFDIRVHNPDFYARVVAGGSVALGESYMDGWWSCTALDQFFERVMAARLDQRVRGSLSVWWSRLKAQLTLAYKKARAYEIGKRHYDIGNDLFTVMLDRRMNYSCAYWQDVADLDAAQEAKLELSCRKLQLEPGLRVLDIGCGWGGFAFYAAEKFGVEVIGVTVSKEQAEMANQCVGDLPVCIELQDYREIEGYFDRIVSIGMFEHVGAPSYRQYMRTVERCLTSDGLFLLHTIGGNRSVNTIDPWIAKYIFPNSMLPSARQISDAAEGLFVLEDWHSFGPHYDPTLMAWYRNVSDNWHLLKAAYDQRFYRMWTYYLLSCAGTFRARRNQLWQIVFSKNGVKGGYAPVRL